MSSSKWNIDATWTLFLDRDGVINKRIFGGYITSPEAFEFEEGVLNALKGLTPKFNRIVVVTNQQGIGKGLMSERNLFDIHTYMNNQIHKVGGKVDKCFFAPNLRGADEDLRKPKPAMAEMAKLEFPEIEFERSVMVGDTDSDIEFGKNLGMKTVRIQTEEPIGLEADLTVSSLNEFYTWLNDELED